MANALGTLFKDIADAIRVKGGATGTMKPVEFPMGILNIIGGSSNARASSGFITTSAENTVNGVTTFAYNLGVKPDLILVTPVDAPTVTVDDPYYFMTTILMSQNLADKVHETTPNTPTGFLYVKSYSAGDADKNWFGQFVAGYETLVTGGLYLGLGGAYDITPNSMKIGFASDGDAAHMAMKLGRKFFYLAAGNLV